VRRTSEEIHRFPKATPPLPLAVLPPASPGPIARAIWAKAPEMDRQQHAGREMANYITMLDSGAANPESLALAIATASIEPMCFLTARENGPNATPKVQLITSVGIYVVALGGSTNELHGHSFGICGRAE
jgi:hypothetical protein